MRGARPLIAGLVAAVALAAAPGVAGAQTPGISPWAGLLGPGASVVGPAAAVSSSAAVADPGSDGDLGTTSAAGLPAGTVRLMAVGDVMLARSIGRRVQQHGPGIVFKGVQNVLDRADILVVNLECAITTSNDQEQKHYTFKAPPVTADVLTKAGVDVAGVANNHAMDWGIKGLEDTLAAMKARGIATPGGGKDKAAATAPAIIDKNGLKVAFLAYVDAFTESTGFNTREWRATADRPGIAIATTKGIAADVKAAKKVADVVVVLVHAGYEYQPRHNGEQKAYAMAALDAGAALVLGAHPHVLQGYKKVGSQFIAWSLGNFVFDGMDGASDTAILALDLSKEGVSHVKWTPVKLVKGFPTLK
ncbi:MAG: CapA family protein [Chloroflexota bacterium]